MESNFSGCSGYSFVEYAVVLFVVGIFIGGGTVVVDRVIESRSVDSVLEQSADLVEYVKQCYTSAACREKGTSRWLNEEDFGVLLRNDRSSHDILNSVVDVTVINSTRASDEKHVLRLNLELEIQGDLNNEFMLKLNSGWVGVMGRDVYRFVATGGCGSRLRCVSIDIHMVPPVESALIDFANTFVPQGDISVFSTRGFDDLGSVSFSDSLGKRDVDGIGFVSGGEARVKSLYIGKTQLTASHVLAYKKLRDLVYSSNNPCGYGSILKFRHGTFRCKSRSVRNTSVRTLLPHVHVGLWLERNKPEFSPVAVRNDIKELMDNVRGIMPGVEGSEMVSANAFHIHEVHGNCRRHNGVDHLSRYNIYFDSLVRRGGRGGNFFSDRKRDKFSPRSLLPIWPPSADISPNAGLRNFPLADVVYYKKPDNGYQAWGRC